MRILFLQKRILFPADNGGKIRTLNVIRHLAKWNEVTYLCNLQPGEENGQREMEELGLRVETVPWRETSRRSLKFPLQIVGNLFSKYPFNVNKDFDPEIRRRAESMLLREDFDVIVCDFVQMARNAIGLDGPALILFQHNVEAEIFRRHADMDRGFLRRNYMAIQYRKMRRFEAMAGNQFDRVVAVSQRDRSKFHEDYGWRHVDVIHTSVDLEYFEPAECDVNPNRLIFVGSLDWLPNEDGLIRFVQETWPLIRNRRPTAEFQIVGRNPSYRIQKLDSIDGVDVIGTVSDVRPYRASAALEVVPLRIGGGTRIKIFEAMAMGKTVVSTSVGAEGLPIANGEHAVLADTCSDFADAVADLLEDRQRREAIGSAAYELVSRQYSTEASARQFHDICQKTVAEKITKGRVVSNSI